MSRLLIYDMINFWFGIGLYIILNLKRFIIPRAREVLFFFCQNSRRTWNALDRWIYCTFEARLRCTKLVFIVRLTAPFDSLGKNDQFFPWCYLATNRE